MDWTAVQNSIDFEAINPFDSKKIMFDEDFYCNDNIPRYMHVDLGLKHDAIGISMAYVSHFKKTKVLDTNVITEVDMPFFQFDFLGKIKAIGGEELFIADVRELIIHEIVRRGFNLKLVTLDRFACLHGDTKIKLLNGTTKTIKELTNLPKDEIFWVYSCDTKTGRKVPGKAKNARCTGKNIPLLKITLDNKKEVICTGNHPFLLRDGTYKNAEDLKIEDSLMPLYLKKAVIGADSTKYEWVQHLNSYSINGEKKKKWQNPEYREKMMERKPVYPKFKSPEPCVYCEKYFMAQRKDKKFCSIKCRSAFYFRYKSLRQYKKEYGEKTPVYNHKVEKIEKYSNADVYDIEVEKYHNFALSSGVFVHNSIETKQILVNEGYAVDNLSLDRTTTAIFVDYNRPSRTRGESTKGNYMAAWSAFKDAISDRRIKVPYLPDYEEEAKHAERRIKGSRITIDCQSSALSLDLLESIAGSVFNAMNNEKNDILYEDEIINAADEKSAVFYTNIGREISDESFYDEQDDRSLYDEGSDFL